MLWPKSKIRNLREAGQSAQSLVEFAITATAFLFVIFATIDFAFLFYAKVTLQNAVRQAGRYAITGNCGANGLPGSNCFVNGPGDRLNIIMQTVSDYSFGLNPTVTVSCISGTCPGYAGGTGANNAGGPGDTVQISAQYTWYPLVLARIFAGGSYTFTVSSTFRNESFAPPAG